MNKLFTLIIGTKQYITTSDSVAWDMCLRCGAEVVSIGQTNRVINSLEYRDRSLLEIFNSIKDMFPINDLRNNLINTTQQKRHKDILSKLEGYTIVAGIPMARNGVDIGTLRTRSMTEGIMSITGCSYEVAKKVIAAKAAGDQRNIRDLAQEFKTVKQ